MSTIVASNAPWTIRRAYNLRTETIVHVSWPCKAHCWHVLARRFPLTRWEISWAAIWTRAQGVLAGL